MLFGDGSAAAMAAADAAKAAVRSVENFDWTFIALLALVVNGVYMVQIQKKNWERHCSGSGTVRCPLAL